VSISQIVTPRFVFFDLVGTLIRGTKPIGEQYAEQARCFGAEADPARLESAFRRAMSAVPPMAFPGRPPGEAAALERAWWTGVVREVVREAGMSDVLSGEAFERFFSSLYDHFTTAAAWELFPDVLPSLERLRGKGAALGLITNYDTRVFRVLEALGLAPLLTTVVIPAHAGAAKPDAAIFAFALARAGVAPSEALHVGDEIGDDYEGAEAAGLRSVLIDRAGKFRGQHGLRRIESLEELGNLRTLDWAT
jgi:putative hydrolase of the HAD superfamily